MNAEKKHREIPFNYTSADDSQAVTWLLGEETWRKLECLRAQRVTGRSARLLSRIFGEVLVHRRNPFLFQELLDDAIRCRRFFAALTDDLTLIEANAAGNCLALEVIAETRALLRSFRAEVASTSHERRRIVSALAPLIGKANVLFDPFTLVAHATDATDWRLYLPKAVAMPTEEAQVAPLLRALGRLGLSAIPRGAGTGLTGGAVPLRPGCVIVNTEKLNRIHGLTRRQFSLADGQTAEACVMGLEAGVITERAMDWARERGLVFATDPTSAWASTIGGNIAENAGGKTAVLWGTCLDNLLSFKLASPGGERFTVRRTNHQLRKILPEDEVVWEICDERGTSRRTIVLRGDEIRRNGLWKDITNKTLKGLPGVQKEGVDGVITSAEFILHPRYETGATFCLEFFGTDMGDAGRTILELVRAFPNEGREVLQALEHFDDQYVRAIGYKVKAPRAETPKAVLLADLAGHAPEEIARGAARIREIAARRSNTHLFEAKDAHEAKLFWADRKKLGAIAAHTNAFKLNEDVVLPLEALAEFAGFCDALNGEEDAYAWLRLIAQAAECLKTAAAPEEAPWQAEKIAASLALCEETLAAHCLDDERDSLRKTNFENLFAELQRRLQGCERLAEKLAALGVEERRRRIVVATHMHAGDGNVHVNIPVLSNDRTMMMRAERTVDRIMEKVATLGGVCSGEHGIGVTKLKYLDPAVIRELNAYRREADPQGLMNPGKLTDLREVACIYTPSFNLLELEARILQYGKMEELAVKIANCVRCGKCKPDCCVFHPARGLFYHPRNKNLAVGALIEALLYEAQRSRSAGFGMLRYLEDVADHCTICHKCVKPCPVAIDTGDVSVLEREILVAHGFKHTPPAVKATLLYLESRSPTFNKIFRFGVVRLGGAVQRLLSAFVKSSLNPDKPAPYPLQILRSPVPPASPQALWNDLPACTAQQTLTFEPNGECSGTVFYFPGCGSERLFSDISAAAVQVLTELKNRVVLAPPYLCCGFPHHANARRDRHDGILLRDTIIFSQIREMFSYLEFDAVTVTCGTCLEALRHMEVEKLFDAPLWDVTRYAAEKGLSLRTDASECLYHAPCHDSLEGKAAATLEQIGGIRLRAVPHCCSEAGTLALSRPDIGDAMLHRKTQALKEALTERGANAPLLTNCPSCLQGLGRNVALGVKPKHIVVELAERLSGPNWRASFRVKAAKAAPIRF